MPKDRTRRKKPPHLAPAPAPPPTAGAFMRCNHLKFTYVNYRDEEHVYLVMPTSVEFSGRPGDGPSWKLNADCVERDSVAHVGPRSFVLMGLRDIEEVYRP